MASKVDATFYALVFLGLALEVCLLCRLSRQRMWRTYFLLFLYVILVALRTVALLLITFLAPERFRTVFWITDAIGLPTNFLIVWEVFRKTFPKGSTLNRIAAKGFVPAGFGLSLFLLDAFWGFKLHAIFNSVYLALDRSFGTVGAVLTLGIMLAARYYGVPLGRNVWGIAVGFGGWASVLTANNALHDLNHAFAPFWQILSPLSFMAMLVVWIWATWNYAPNPVLETTVDESDLNDWSDDWNRAVSSARRVIHP